MSTFPMNTSSMWLVYEDNQGVLYYQHWKDATTNGGLVDPDTDEDMDIVGWTTELP